MRHPPKSVCILLAAVSTVSSVRASLPIFGGPTVSTASGGATSIVVGGPPGKSVGEGFVVGTAVTTNPSYPSQSPTLGYVWSAFGTTPISLGGHAVQFLYSSSVTVNGINRFGASVGSVYTPVPNFPGASSSTSARRWDADGTETILAPLDSIGGDQPPSGATYSVANAINDGGTVVGLSPLAFGPTSQGQRAVRWDPGAAKPVNLGTPTTTTGGQGSSAALAVSDSGIITGVADLYGAGNASLGQRVVRWDANSTTPITLGTFATTTAGVSQATLNAMNQSGAAVGSVFNYTNTSTGAHIVSPTRWAAGDTQAQGLYTLTGSRSVNAPGEATDINDRGVAVGFSQKLVNGANRGERGCYWDTNLLAPSELPALNTTSGGFGVCRARAVNNLNYSVGYSNKYTGDSLTGQAAVLWRPNGTVIDLNTYLAPGANWLLLNAADISEAGFISGFGNYTFLDNGTIRTQNRGFMILVPEAGTYGLGDANFDLKVNFDDLIILAQHYNQANGSKAVTVGDFNLDGTTNFDDLIALAQHYNTTPGSALVTGAAFAADWALAQSLVPEPATLAAIAWMPLILRRRLLT